MVSNAFVFKLVSKLGLLERVCVWILLVTSFCY